MAYTLATSLISIVIIGSITSAVTSKSKEVIHYPCNLSLVPEFSNEAQPETWSLEVNTSQLLPYHMPNGLNGLPRNESEQAFHDIMKRTVGRSYNPELDMLFSDLPLSVNASVLHRNHVLEWGDTLYRLADPWVPAPTCAAVYFGSGEFLTGRHGSRLLMLLLGLRYAKLFNFCTMIFSLRQRQQLQDLISLPETVDLSSWLGTDKCTENPFKLDSPSNIKACIKADSPLKSLKHFQLFDPRGDVLAELRAGMIQLFASFRVIQRGTSIEQSAASVSEFDEAISMASRNDVIVMHMRSGDVWSQRVKWPEHVQPPCAYYVAAFRNGPNKQPFRHAIVIAQDDSNPCVEYIKKGLPANYVTFVLRGTLKTDAIIMANAAHMAISASALPLSLSYINPNLRSLHLPFGKIENRWNYWAVFGWSETAMPHTQHLYSFPKFPNDHDSRWARLPMIETFCLYDQRRVMHRVIQGGSQK